MKFGTTPVDPFFSVIVITIVIAKKKKNQSERESLVRPFSNPFFFPVHQDQLGNDWKVSYYFVCRHHSSVIRSARLNLVVGGVKPPGSYLEKVEVYSC